MTTTIRDRHYVITSPIFNSNISSCEGGHLFVPPRIRVRLPDRFPIVVSVNVSDLEFLSARLALMPWVEGRRDRHLRQQGTVMSLLFWLSILIREVLFGWGKDFAVRSQTRESA